MDTAPGRVLLPCKQLVIKLRAWLPRLSPPPLSANTDKGLERRAGQTLTVPRRGRGSTHTAIP